MLGAGVVQSLFFALIGALLCVVLVVSRPQSFEMDTAWLNDQALLALGGSLVIVAVMAVLMRRPGGRLAVAEEGAAILRARRRYASQVLAVQAASSLVRMAATATFMYAYGIPVSPWAVLLIIAANTISSTLAVTPGGVGTQQALASLALRNFAPSSIVATFSLGQQITISAWDMMFGLLLLWPTIGSTATHGFFRPKHSSRTGSAADTAIAHSNHPL